MTYSQLKELIAEMDAKELEQKVVVSSDGGWHEIVAATTLTWVKEPEEGETQYPVGQIILEAV